MSSDFGPSFWTNSLSSAAKGSTGTSTNFSGNWNTIDRQASTRWAQDLSILQQLVNTDPALAIMFFLTTMAPDMMQIANNNVNKMSDQVADVANVTAAIGKIKQIFNTAKGKWGLDDARLTKEFQANLTTLKSYLQNDGWLNGSSGGNSSLFSTLGSEIDKLTTLLNTSSLGTIWAQATGVSYSVTPPTPNVTFTDNGTSTSSIVISNLGGKVSNVANLFNGSLTSYGLTYTSQGVPDSTSITFNFRNSSSFSTLLNGSSSNNIWDMLKPIIGQTVTTTELSSPDNTNLNKFLTSFDVMTSTSSALSNTFQSQLQVRASQVQERANFWKGMIDTVMKSISGVVQKSGPK